MGISTHYYTVYGVKVEYDEAFAEAYDEVYGEKHLPDVIIDGMGGEYMIFGKILYDSGDLRWDKIGDVFVEIDIDTLATTYAEYCERFIAKFPEHKHLITRPFKLMTFVHYS